MRKIINNVLAPVLRILGIARWVFVTIEKVKIFLARIKLIGQVKRVKGKSVKKGPVLFCTIENLNYNLDYFIDYYKNLGVTNFVFLLFPKSYELEAKLNEYDFIEIWKYKKAELNELNHLALRNYFLTTLGKKRWVLLLKANEFLVYPSYNSRNINELCEYLDGLEQTALYCLTVDRYKNHAIGSDKIVQSLTLGDFPFFDRNNFIFKLIPIRLECRALGGPELRTTYAEIPRKCPPKNSFSLLKVEGPIQFLEGKRVLNHFQYNDVIMLDHRLPSACIFTYDLENYEENKYFEDYISIKYEDETQLEEQNLMQRGVWF